MKNSPPSRSLRSWFFCAILFSALPAWSQSVWKGTAGPEWSKGANWSDGVPNSNKAIVKFDDTAANRLVTVDGTYTFQQLQIMGQGGEPYVIGGDTLVYDRGEAASNGFNDTSRKRDTTVGCNITVQNSGPPGTASVISKSGPGGNLIFAGTLRTQTSTTFDARGGANLIIAGDLVGGANAGTGYNQCFQVLSGSAVSFEGTGVSSNPDGGIVLLALGSKDTAGTMNLNRPSSLAGGQIVLLNTGSQSNSALNLGADNAITNEEGTFRTQIGNDGLAVVLNTHGFGLDLGNRKLQLFPGGSGVATFTLDLGEGNSHVCFANSRKELWRGQLAIVNFTKGRTTVRFGTDDAALTPAQLDKITINGANGVQIDAEGYLVAP